ncbi:hypothetical protein GOBAR_DD12092 [Gossypium barbadense]|nr:hypothetical protein GOBAR_DD12092 [Gossypium barbadense]
MATPCPLPVTAAQVGTYFVERYYQVIIQQPHLVHQFYSDANTMVLVDGSHRETAAAMLQIHALVMSLNYTGIEIKTACSLESWNAGVLVMVSGSVLVKDFCSRREFVQTFFLAPQEKGFFVLNDIFHFIEEQQIQHHPAVRLSQHNLDHKLTASATIPEPVPGYLLGGDIQRREFVAPVDVKENGPVDNYTLSEQLQQALESESLVDKSSVRESNGSLLHTVNTVQEHVPPVEEPFGEPQKHNYASVGWVDAEAAIQQKLQGGVLALEVMAGEVPTMEVNETTVDREETVFTAKHLDKIEAYLASKYIKLDKVHRAGIFYLL